MSRNDYTKISIYVLIFISAALAEGTASFEDPKSRVLAKILDEAPTSYCVIHIEKNKKFTPKESEPTNTQETKMSSAEWFRESRKTYKLDAKTVNGEKPKPGQKKINNESNPLVGKSKVNKQDIKHEEIKEDQLFVTFQYVKSDGSVFKPEYTVTEADKTNGEGYGIITDCYFANGAKKIKRQVRYLYCSGKNTEFAIKNYMMVSDGDDGQSEKVWTTSYGRFKFIDFGNEGNQFYSGPLSSYADAFMDTEEEDKCILRIKSQEYVLKTVLLFIIAILNIV